MKSKKQTSIRRTTKSTHLVTGTVETDAGKIRLSIETKPYKPSSPVPSAVEQAVKTTLEILQANLQYCPYCDRFGGTHDLTGPDGKYPRCLREALNFSVEKMG